MRLRKRMQGMPGTDAINGLDDASSIQSGHCVGVTDVQAGAYQAGGSAALSRAAAHEGTGASRLSCSFA